MTDAFATRRRLKLNCVQHAEAKVHWEDGVSHGGGPHTWVKVSELTKLDALQYSALLNARTRAMGHR